MGSEVEGLLKEGFREKMESFTSFIANCLPLVSIHLPAYEYLYQHVQTTPLHRILMIMSVIGPNLLKLNYLVGLLFQVQANVGSCSCDVGQLVCLFPQLSAARESLRMYICSLQLSSV